VNAKKIWNLMYSGSSGVLALFVFRVLLPLFGMSVVVVVVIVFFIDCVVVVLV
jgi:hypothetical protein